MSSSEPGALSAGTVKKRTAGTGEENMPNSKVSKQDDQHGWLWHDFPIDSKNPFMTEFCGSDIVLIVEGKKLHTHRLILTLYSPYFRVMLGTQHFAEANANTIPLKGSPSVKMEYEAMVTFLFHLYPVHSFHSITDDSALEVLFPLSEYFQCQHVRTKCESYIHQQLYPPGGQTSVGCDVNKALLYLHLCAKYGAKQFIEKLFEILSSKRLPDMQKNEDFKSLSPEMQRDVFQGRVLYLEKRYGLY